MVKLTKKLGPLPVWAWALVIVGGFLAAKYLRAHSASSTAADQTAYDNSQPVDPGSGVGAGASAGGSGFATVPTAGEPVQGGFTVADMQAANAGYTGLLTSAIDSLVGHNDPTVLGLSGNLDTAIGALNDTNQALIAAGYPAHPTGDTAHAGATVPAARSAGRPSGVVSTRVLANGATLTTYADGRVEEQAPGHSAYVTKAAPDAAQNPQTSGAVRPAVHTVASGQGAKAPAHSTAIAPPKAAPATKYYTYKNQVPGGNVKYTQGKGYYAG